MSKRGRGPDQKRSAEGGLLGFGDWLQSRTERNDTWIMMSRDCAAKWVVVFADMGTRRGDSFQGSGHAVGIMHSELQMFTRRCLWGNPSDGGRYLEASAYLILKFMRQRRLELDKWTVTGTLQR